MSESSIVDAKSSRRVSWSGWYKLYSAAKRISFWAIATLRKIATYSNFRATACTVLPKGKLPATTVSDIWGGKCCHLSWDRSSCFSNEHSYLVLIDEWSSWEVDFPYGVVLSRNAVSKLRSEGFCNGKLKDLRKKKVLLIARWQQYSSSGNITINKLLRTRVEWEELWQQTSDLSWLCALGQAQVCSSSRQELKLSSSNAANCTISWPFVCLMYLKPLISILFGIPKWLGAVWGLVAVWGTWSMCI